MLSEIKNLCKRLFEWIKTNEKPARRGGGDLFLTAVIILVATISFGLGRLSKIREEKTPITIESIATLTETTANVSNKNVTESQKIFVASRNGKKYYYIWCESSKIIKEQNRIWFATKEEAEKAGYEPAANCKGLK